MVKGGDAYKPISIVGLNDFHGQLSPTTTTIDGQTVPVGGAAQLATMFDEDLAALPGPGLILAGGDNVGASPPNSALLEDMPTIDVENLWGLDATSYGNHEFDFGVTRLQAQQARAHFPFLATNIVETATGNAPSWVKPSAIFTVNGIKVGVIGAELLNTPELVSAGATAGLTFLPEAARIKAESERLRKLGVKVQVVVIHQGTNFGLNPLGNAPGTPWVGPILDIANALQDTTVDAMIVGHTHRVSNLMVGDILVTEGINAGATLLGPPADGEGRRRRLGRRRDAAGQGHRRHAQRADVKAVVDAANDDTRAVLQQGHRRRQAEPRHQARPDPAPRVGDGQHGRGRHARGARIDPATGLPEAEAAYTNSGGLRQDLLCTPPSGTRADLPDHPGRAVRRPAVRQRDGHRDPDRGADADGLPQRVHARLRSELRRRHRPVPADLRPQGPVPLQRDDTRRRQHLEDAERDRRSRHGGR